MIVGENRDNVREAEPLEHLADDFAGIVEILTENEGVGDGRERGESWGEIVEVALRPEEEASAGVGI